jgi:hypothetical protein
MSSNHPTLTGGFTLTNRREQEAFTIASVELEAIRTNLTKRERELLASFDQRWDHGDDFKPSNSVYRAFHSLCAEHGVKITYQKRSGTGPMEPVEWVEPVDSGSWWPSEEPDYKKRIEMKAEFRQRIRRQHQIKLGLLSMEPAVTVEMSDRLDQLEANIVQMQARIDELEQEPARRFDHRILDWAASAQVH